MGKRQPMLHFHNGHSLEVWCGKQSKLANWTTVAAWVTCPKCQQMINARQGGDPRPAPQEGGEK